MARAVDHVDIGDVNPRDATPAETMQPSKYGIDRNNSRNAFSPQPVSRVPSQDGAAHGIGDPRLHF